MTINMKQVHSSHIHSVGHDPDTNELHVKFDNGKTAVYSAVDKLKADRIMNSYSIGKALHSEVRGQHEHKYI